MLYTSIFSRLTGAKYEAMVHRLVQSSLTIDPSRGPVCNSSFVPPPSATEAPSYVLYINMTRRHDYDTWLHLAKVSYEKPLLRTVYQHV